MNSTRAAAAAACGVTPQAQNTGTSPSGAAPVGGPYSGLRKIGADCGGVADMYRRAVVEWKTRGHLRGDDRLLRRQPAHRHHHVAAKAPRRLGPDGRTQHPAVLICRHAGALQRLIEGDARTDEKGHQVIAPQPGDAVHVGQALTVAIDGVTRKIGAQVRARRQPPRLGAARVGHLEQRTGALVALAIEHEVKGQRLRNHHQVTLYIAHGEAARTAPMAFLANGEARLAAGLGNGAHCVGSGRHLTARPS